MKVALLISGYLRNYHSNVSFIKNKLSKQFGNVDIYLHITKNENKEDKYFNTINEQEVNKDIESSFSPILKLIEPNITFSKNKAKNNILNQWSKLYKLNNLLKLNEKNFNKKYDFIVRYRPDVCLEDINFLTNLDTIIIPKDSKIDINKLTQVTDPHICDSFAYGPAHLMNQYFEIFENLHELIDQYGTVSETLLYYYLTKNNIKYKLKNINYGYILSKCNIIALCGDSGSGKTTFSNILKQYFSNPFTLECDRYHKWERNDKNWEKYTHLNPEANFITKMNKDIFDLKVGKKVYHVNYDHKTGKFTEKQQISNKSDNLIVCGLHSLYNKQENIYNLKIFLDPDINLKTRWKVIRDVKERGYSTNKVLREVKKREKDYIKYIHPQRLLSDIVINFFTEDKIDVEDFLKECKIQLRLFIKKKYNLTKILNSFIRNKIQFDIDFIKDKDFNILTFKEFKKTKLLQKFNGKRNDFYDYIMFTILNLKNI